MPLEITEATETQTGMAPSDEASQVVPQYTALPRELTALSQWALWQRVWEPEGRSGGRWDLYPVHPETGERLNCSDKVSGTTFEIAVRACEQKPGTGVGFFLAEDSSFTVVEVENAITSSGKLTGDAYNVIQTLSSYTERTADGRGIRCIVAGILPPGGRRRDTIEMMDCRGFIAVTGCLWDDAPIHVQPRQRELESLHRNLFPSPPPRPAMPLPTGVPAADAELLAIAFRSTNGARIEQLYRGDTRVIPGDRNAGDLALCSMLGFYTGNDPARLDRLFRNSRLFRRRWDEVVYSDGMTYGKATVQKALEGCLIFYNYPVQEGAGSPLSDEELEKLVGKIGRRPLERLAELHPATASNTRNTNGTAKNAPSWPAGYSAGGDVNPVLLAEQMGRAEGLAQRETVLNAREAAQLLKISPRMLRRTVKPWRRFGASAAGDRWLLSDLLSKPATAPRSVMLLPATTA